MKSFGPKKFQISPTGKKVPLWQFFRMGWDGFEDAVRSTLKNPSQKLKNNFVLGANEYIERLEGKIGE